ncbi:MAG: hypothetical protein AB1679_11610 [Actinomycetota bacterium]
MRRLIVTITLGVVIGLLMPPPAIARNRVRAVCDDEGCEAGAATERAGARRGRARSWNPVSCRYYRLDVPDGTVLTRPDGSPIAADGPGRWFEKVCVDARETAAIEAAFPDRADPINDTLALQSIVRAPDRTPVFIRTADTPALIEEARSRLTFPDPQPRFAPSSPWTFVNHPTALWLDGGLNPTSATAEVPGLRVTVTAEPTRIDWDTADGTVVSCPAPGRPPDPKAPGDRGDCVHVWTWPRAGTPDGAYPVTATVYWHVTWTSEGAPGGGDLGTIPRRTSAVMVPVAEIQAVNIPPEESR